MQIKVIKTDYYTNSESFEARYLQESLWVFSQIPVTVSNNNKYCTKVDFRKSQPAISTQPCGLSNSCDCGEAGSTSM